MKTYLVGGAVRDALLGLPAAERDWVVVGASPEQMAARGFRPVGRDFPVFLHPETHEEYALARTERKSGPGYRGFTFHTGPDVTLEDDLGRRDLTINAIARAEDGAIVDPHRGRRDLEARVLRHVSPAFREDPVRILRLARFAARFASRGFRVAGETIALAQEMVRAGAARELVVERVWQEFRRALMSDAPQVFVQTLLNCEAWADIFPQQRRPQELGALLARAAGAALPLAPRFACAAWTAEDAAQWCADLRVPRQLARAAGLLRAHYAAWADGPPAAERVLDLIERTDGLRRPESLQQFRAAARVVSAEQKRAPSGIEAALDRAVSALGQCDVRAAARGGGDVVRQVRAVRIAALRAALD